MKYRCVVLNRSMNPIYKASFEVFEHKSFLDVVKRHLEVYWRLKSQDSDASFRLIPDDDKTLNLFTESNEIPIF